MINRREEWEDRNGKIWTPSDVRPGCFMITDRSGHTSFWFGPPTADGPSTTDRISNGLQHDHFFVFGPSTTDRISNGLQHHHFFFRMVVAAFGSMEKVYDRWYPRVEKGCRKVVLQAPNIAARLLPIFLIYVICNKK